MFETLLTICVMGSDIAYYSDEEISAKIYIYLFFFAFQDDNFVVSALLCAAEEGNIRGLEELLSMANIDINITNKVSQIHVIKTCAISVFNLV